MKRFLLRVLNKVGLLGKLRLVRTLDVRGQRIRVPVVGGVGLGDQFLAEAWMLDLMAALKESLQRGLFLDVGANIGQTLIKLKSVCPEADYLGIEPNLTCAAYVRELIAENGYSRARILPLGLFTEDGARELEFYSANDTDSCASMIKDYRPTQPVRQRQWTAVMRWERLADTMAPGPLGVVKIDVEGAELEVLRSLEDAIRDQRPLVMVEVLPVYSEQNIQRLQRQQMIEGMLAAWDYRLFRVIKSERERLRALEEIAEFGIHGDMRRCDYLLAPGERAPELARISP